MSLFRKNLKVDIRSGLVADWKFDERNGTIAHDSSGNNLNGTIANPIWVTARKSGGLNFTGTTTQNVNFGNPSSLSFPSSDFSIVSWIYPTSATYYIVVINKGDGASATNSQYELLTSSGGNGKFSFDIFIGGANNQTSEPTAHTLNQWYFVCGVRSGSNCILYVNGINVASNVFTGTLNTTTNAVKVGVAGSLPMYGNIDMVRIYNRALTSTEVIQLYKNT